MAKVKGSHVVSIVKALRRHREAASARLPQGLHSYLDDRILVSQWYSEAEFLELMRAALEIVPELGGASFELLGEVGARQDVEQHYAHVLGSADVDYVARRAHVLWQMLHDTGELRIHEFGEGHFEIEVADYPSLHPELCRCTTGYFTGMLRVTGAKDVEVTEVACTQRGAPACRWSLKW